MESSLRKPARILVIDDDPDLRSAMTLILAQAGFDVVQAEGGRVAVAAAKEEAFDVAITDLKMPVMSGTETLVALRQIDASLPVIIASGYLTDEAERGCRSLGAFGCLRKPFEMDELLSFVDRALRSRPAGHAEGDGGGWPADSSATLD